MFSPEEKTRLDTERAKSRTFKRSPYVVPSQAVLRKEERIRSIREENFFDDLGIDKDKVTFNGSLIICINGTPYYINIPYDKSKGPYALSEGADFPVEEPTV